MWGQVGLLIFYSPPSNKVRGWRRSGEDDDEEVLVSSVKQVSSVGSTHTRAPPKIMRERNAGFMRSLLYTMWRRSRHGGFCNSMAYYSIAYMAYNSIAQHSMVRGRSRRWMSISGHFGAYNVHGNVNDRFEKTNRFFYLLELNPNR
jgi:hypothetical protein